MDSSSSLSASQAFTGVSGIETSFSSCVEINTNREDDVLSKPESIYFNDTHQDNCNGVTAPVYARVTRT